jgi:hypothetical protein
MPILSRSEAIGHFRTRASAAEPAGYDLRCLALTAIAAAAVRFSTPSLA